MLKKFRKLYSTKTEPMVSRIYFDTNVLQAAGWPRPSPTLENLLKLARMLKVRLFFPHVVKLELEKHWLQKISDHYTSANSGLAQLKRHLSHGLKISVPELKSFDQEQIKEDYRDFTRALESEWNIETVPLTNRLDELVTMAVDERPPFAKEGKGFQDAVIYLSVLEHLGRTDEAAVFLTNDGGFEKIDPVRFQKVALTIYREVVEVVDLLVKAAEDREIISWESRRETTKESLKSQLKDIEQFVNEKLSIPDNILDFISVGSNLVVKALRRVDVLGVKDVQIPLDEATLNQSITVSVVLTAKLHVVAGKRYTGRSGPITYLIGVFGLPKMLNVDPRNQKEDSPTNAQEDAVESPDPDIEISFEQQLTLEAKATLSTAVTAVTDIDFTSVHLTNPPHDTLPEFVDSPFHIAPQ